MASFRSCGRCEEGSGNALRYGGSAGAPEVRSLWQRRVVAKLSNIAAGLERHDYSLKNTSRIEDAVILVNIRRVGESKLLDYLYSTVFVRGF